MNIYCRDWTQGSGNHPKTRPMAVATSMERDAADGKYMTPSLSSHNCDS